MSSGSVLEDMVCLEDVVVTCINSSFVLNMAKLW